MAPLASTTNLAHPALLATLSSTLTLSSGGSGVGAVHPGVEAALASLLADALGLCLAAGLAGLAFLGFGGVVFGSVRGVGVVGGLALARGLGLGDAACGRGG